MIEMIKEIRAAQDAGATEEELVCMIDNYFHVLLVSDLSDQEVFDAVRILLVDYDVNFCTHLSKEFPNIAKRCIHLTMESNQ